MTFLTALLTGLGVGSGGLYIFYLTLIKNVPQAQAQGMNLLFFLSASLAAACINIAKKRIVFPPLLFLFPCGAIGALFGCWLASKLDTHLLSIMFGILITAVGIIGFIRLLKNR